MFAALILAMSIVALFQFALYYWRAILAGASAQPVSEEVRTAARIDGMSITGKDFKVLSAIHHVIPGGSGSFLSTIEWWTPLALSFQSLLLGLNARSRSVRTMSGCRLIGAYKPIVS
jgi:hypothetical protein